MTATLDLAARPVAIYAIGGPGTGKSTALAGALRQLEWTALPEELPLYGLLRGHAMVGPDGRPDGRYLGIKRAEFPGTDALSFGVMPDALKWTQQAAVSRLALVVGEGARLTTRDFLGALSRSCRLLVVHCINSGNDLAARRPGQNVAWQRGRLTAAANVYDEARLWQGRLGAPDQFCRTVEVDSGTSSPSEIADTIAGLALGLLTTQRAARTALERTR